MPPKPVKGYRHYSCAEKKIFLELLARRKEVVESKKCNAAALQEKNIAWAAITMEYNNAEGVRHMRNVAQLKKLWTNMKQAQRDVFHKKKVNNSCSTPRSSNNEIANLFCRSAFSHDKSDDQLYDYCSQSLPATMKSCNSTFDPTNKSDDVLSDYDDEESIIVEAGPPIVKIENLSPALSAKSRYFDCRDSGTNDATQAAEEAIYRDDEAHLKLARLRQDIEHEEEKEKHLQNLRVLELREALAKAKLAELRLARALKLSHKENGNIIYDDDLYD